MRAALELASVFRLTPDWGLATPTLGYELLDEMKAGTCADTIDFYILAYMA